MIGASRTNTPTVRVHGWVGNDGNNPPNKLTTPNWKRRQGNDECQERKGYNEMCGGDRVRVGVRVMKNLNDYGWVQKESNETDADVGDPYMALSVQMDLRY